MLQIARHGAARHGQQDLSLLVAVPRLLVVPLRCECFDFRGRGQLMVGADRSLLQTSRLDSKLLSDNLHRLALRVPKAASIGVEVTTGLASLRSANRFFFLLEPVPDESANLHQSHRRKTLPENNLLLLALNINLYQCTCLS
jgi:hypothetical protein